MDLDLLSRAVFESYKPYLSLTQNKKNFTLYGRRPNPRLDFQSIVLEHIGKGLLSPQAAQDESLFSQLRDRILIMLLESRQRDLPEQLTTYQIGQDVLTGTCHILEQGALLPLSFEAWRTTLTEEEYEILYSQRKRMVAAFNPHKPLSWVDKIDTPLGPKEFEHFNMYIPAAWTRIEDPDTLDYTLVESFMPDFFETFLPIKKERDYVIYWLNNLTYQRCQDMLVLIGMQGNGKNTLMQLASIIAGQHNSITAAKAFGKDKFNSEVFRRKLVNLDEYSLKGAAKDSIKCWLNELITVEAKKADPQPMQNHCSFILANNADTSIDLEYKDRRFTIPSLAKTDLINAWGMTRVAAMQQAIAKSEMFSLSFPHWIRRRCSEIDTSKFEKKMFLKTERFEYLAEISKPNWFKSFKRLLAVNVSVNALDIRKQTNMRVGDDKIIEQLNKEEEERKHRKMEPHKIANIRIDEGVYNYESRLYPSPGEAAGNPGDDQQTNEEDIRNGDKEI